MRLAGVRNGMETYHDNEDGTTQAARSHPAPAALEGPRARGGTMDISDWRVRIDELDEQIVKLLCERAACAIAIGQIKQTNVAPIYEPRREQEVFDHVRAVNPGPLRSAQIQDIYERVMDVMRSLQRPGAGDGERWCAPAMQDAPHK